MVKAYFRKHGKNAPQPDRNYEVVEIFGNKYAVLSNVNGVLAVFRVFKDGTLRMLSESQTKLFIECWQNI
jgi:hypothetical protein